MSRRNYNDKLRKRADRRHRKLIHRARNMIKSLGLGEIYFYDYYDLYLSGGSDEGYAFSTQKSIHGYEITDREKLKNIIYKNISIYNLDNKKHYANFEEYRKERLIIKMLGLK